MSTYERPNVMLVTRALIQNQADQFLIIQRPPDDQRYPSQWELPGGKVDIGETPSEALEREVREETGLIVSSVSDVQNSIDSYTYDNDLTDALTYVAITTLVKTRPGQVVLSSEHTDYAWEFLPDALDYDLTTECEKALSLLGPLALAGAQYEKAMDTYRLVVLRLLDLK